MSVPQGGSDVGSFFKSLFGARPSRPQPAQLARASARATVDRGTFIAAAMSRTLRPWSRSARRRARSRASRAAAAEPRLGPRPRARSRAGG